MLVLITYDVNTETAAGKTRLRKVAKQCVNYGRRVQNSVFECILDNAQCIALKALLTDIIDSKVDSLRFYYLGINTRRKWSMSGSKKVLLPIRSCSSKNWCEQEVHMNSYGDSHLKNYEITFINLFF